MENKTYRFKELLQRREQAKDWKAADEARVELARKGIDTKNGPVWKRARELEQ